MGQELASSISDRNLVAPAAEQELDVRAYLDVLRRRYLYLVIPAVGLFAVVCLVTFLLPSVYQASAKILVVSQLIPSDLAASTVAASATERIKVIEQRLTTRDNLLAIAQKYNLYSKQRGMLSPSELVDWIREATQIQQIALDTAQAQGRRPGAEAVGFSLSFNYADPVIAARVANELVSSILEQNIQSRTARAASTSKFFGQQVKRLEDDLAALEQKIADFKKANEQASPETLNDRRARLATIQSTIAAIDHIATLGTGPGSGLEAQAQLTELQARLKDSELQLKNAQEQRSGLEELRKKGYVTKTRILDSDNRISKLQADIDGLRANITVAQSKVIETGGNPESLPKRRAELVQQAAALEQSIARTPDVESGLNALLREYDNLKADYRLSQGKTNLATTGEQMEEDRQAERFEVIEQAAVPSEPISPNRPRIVLAGAFVSVAAGIGLVLLMEMMDKSIRSSRDLERLLHIRPLAAIPYLATIEEKSRKSYALQRSLGVAVVLLGAGLILVHVFFMPFDQLLEKLLQLPKFYGII